MKLTFHGGAKEVGRSCIEIESEGNRFLLDCGIKFTEGGFDYPINVFKLKELHGLFLSHAHLDHSGALPLFEHHDLICPIFCTKQTKMMTEILLKDSYKIQRIKNIHSAYNKIDLKKVKKSMKFIKFDKKYKHKNIRYIFFNAGHVPGSSSILLEIEGKKLLYTGDINTVETELMKAADTNYGNETVDIMICESTYGNTILPERKGIEERFLSKIEEVIKRKGSVLIPVFALGRSQEILILLSRKDFGVPIYLDGMAKKATMNILENPSNYENNLKDLEKMFKGVELIASDKHRDSIVNNQGIFVTTSGMLQGGPVLHYLKEMWHNKDHAILLTGYQCKGTNGRTLYETGYVFIDGWKTEVKCEVEKFDFSGHADANHLKELIKKVNPKILVIQHGDEEQAVPLKEWAEQNIGCRVYLPNVDETISLE